MNKYLLITPMCGCGLCNQIFSYGGGILLGHISKRQVCIETFLGDYMDRNIKSPIQDIIDLEHLNKLIKDIGLNTTVITNFKPSDFKKMQVSDKGYDQIPHIQHGLDTHLTNEHNSSIRLIDVYAPVNFKSLDPTIETKKSYLYKYFKFNKKWYDAAEFVKTELGISKYKAIHLRLEDDIIRYNAAFYKCSFEEANAAVQLRYTSTLDKHFQPDDVIYLCTGLGKFPNVNNVYLDELKKKYPNIKESSSVKFPPHFGNITKRDYLAIVDIILAVGSTFFMGYNSSSFTIIVAGRNGNTVQV